MDSAPWFTDDVDSLSVIHTRSPFEPSMACLLIAVRAADPLTPDRLVMPLGRELARLLDVPHREPNLERCLRRAGRPESGSPCAS